MEPSALPIYSPHAMRRNRRAAVGVFGILFVAYGYFHQGGGWNQNSRFDQARAIVEDGTLAINDFLLYRLTVQDDGRAGYERVLMSDAGEPPTRLPRVNTLDISLYEGRYYPNKPPGTSFLAAAVYAAVYGVERALGADPDSWVALTVGLYLTTWLTVGLLGALGGVVFLWISLRLFPDVSLATHVSAALVFGLGTLMFPYGTLLLDAVPVATLSLCAFALLLSLRREPGGADRAPALLFGAGTLCGLIVFMNYALILTALGLGLYALWACAPRARIVWFAAGGVLPALALAAYHAACFDDPLTLVHEHQMDVFTTVGSRYFGMFVTPRPPVIAELLFLPYRGLFVSSPVLLLSVYGLARMAAGTGTRRAEALVFAGLGLIYLLLISSLNGWQGGSMMGPRYLMPAVPFLALALTPAFARLGRAAALLAIPSILLMTVITAVDPQVSLRFQNPLVEFYWPVATGKTVRASGFHLRGPVSVHPIGVPGGEIEVLYPDTRYARWNSFNLGELLFPGSWASLLPLLSVIGFLGIAFLRPEPRRDEPE